MIDRLVERWLGPALIVVGCVALGVAAALELGWISEPLPLPPPGVTTMLYLPALTYRPELYLTSGVALVLLGAQLARHFRRERQG